MSNFAADLAMSPTMAADAAAQQDLVRRKQGIDALRKRLGDTATKEEKLRESCEGFEAVFLQKMWEEMRKNVSKEGYLHSKDEETYQSMFDVELSKKMASAGGIGLADMLYEQLSQQISDAGRSATPTARKPLPVDAALTPKQATAKAPEAAPSPPKADTRELLTAENLYSPLDTGVTDMEDLPLEDGPALEKALQEIRAELAGVSLPTQNAAPENTPGENTFIHASINAATGMPENIPPLVPNTIEKTARKAEGTAFSSWQASNAHVSVKPKPVNRSKSKRQSKTQRPDMAVEQVLPGKFASNAGKARGILPAEARWPLEGRIASGFGWQETGFGKREWNPGVTIEGRPGAPVTACMQGKVLFAGPAEGYDNLVVLDHGNDFKSYYGNITESAVSPGDVVPAGTTFAKIAPPKPGQEETANSSSLFFALKRGEMALNPEAAIPRMVTASR